MENRTKFALEILEATSKAIGAGRVGIRLSPFANAQGVYTADSPNEYVEISRLIHERVPDLGYVHFVEPRADPAKLKGWATYAAEHDEAESLQPYRDIFTGSKTQFLSAGGYSPELARKYVEEHGGGVVFGRWFISSQSTLHSGCVISDDTDPDLPERIKNGWPLEPYDRYVLTKK